MIQTRIKESVAWLQINRPKQKNALSIQLLEQILEALTQLEKNKKVRVIVLYGKENFSAGGDINDMFVDNAEKAKEVANKVQGIYHKIELISKPIIAYTKGLVLGGGIELALVCDIIISHPNSKFSLPEASLGIIPGGGATQRLKAVIGKQNAAYMLFTGDLLSADKMLSLNLIQEIADDIDRVIFIANSIAQKNPTAIKELKQLLQKDMDFDAETKSFAKLLLGEGKDGIQSFIKEKKMPNW